MCLMRSVIVVLAELSPVSNQGTFPLSKLSLNPPFRLVLEQRGPTMLLKMPQKLLKTAHYIELGSYQHWPVLIPQRIRLYTYEQIPLFLKENPYITDGYRAHLPSKLCLRRCQSQTLKQIRM